MLLTPNTNKQLFIENMKAQKKTIQQMGGEAVLKKYSKEHFKNLSKKAVEARNKIWKLGKKKLKEEELKKKNSKKKRALMKT